ncbi:MAG TPA: hypothetical protein VKR82_09545 [Candidatus Acidoferrales bacterium]|nr:hypothetical protein [Candidatus Acidoferrales bacterium]
MELVERYLQAVKFWLPKEQQDDIAAELSEDLRSQIEEQEGKLGRRLDNAEIGAILKRHGRPLLVANRYLPQQFLIGPALFPIYKFVLKIVALCYLIPWLLVWFGLMSFDSSYRAAHTIGGDLIGAWGSLWTTAILAFGVVTAVFAILERVQNNSGFLDNWEPAKLPPVRNAKQIPRFQSVMAVAANILFLAWWINGKWSFTFFENSGVRIVLAPVWQPIYWAVLFLSLATIVLFSVNLARPQWTLSRAAIKIVLDCAGAGVFCWFLKARVLAEITVPNLSSARAAHLVDTINTLMARAFPFGILAWALIILLADIGLIYRIGSGRRQLAQSLTVMALLAGTVVAAGVETFCRMI